MTWPGRTGLRRSSASCGGSATAAGQGILGDQLGRHRDDGAVHHRQPDHDRRDHPEQARPTVGLGTYSEQTDRITCLYFELRRYQQSDLGRERTLRARLLLPPFGITSFLPTRGYGTIGGAGRPRLEKTALSLRNPATGQPTLTSPLSSHWGQRPCVPQDLAASANRPIRLASVFPSLMSASQKLK
jgi:hypothetical protein